MAVTHDHQATMTIMGQATHSHLLTHMTHDPLTHCLL